MQMTRPKTSFCSMLREERLDHAPMTPWLSVLMSRCVSWRSYVRRTKKTVNSTPTNSAQPMSREPFPETFHPLESSNKSNSRLMMMPMPKEEEASENKEKEFEGVVCLQSFIPMLGMLRPPGQDSELVGFPVPA